MTTIQRRASKKRSTVSSSKSSVKCSNSNEISVLPLFFNYCYSLRNDALNDLPNEIKSALLSYENVLFHQQINLLPSFIKSRILDFCDVRTINILARSGKKGRELVSKYSEPINRVRFLKNHNTIVIDNLNTVDFYCKQEYSGFYSNFKEGYYRKITYMDQYYQMLEGNFVNNLAEGRFTLYVQTNKGYDKQYWIYSNNVPIKVIRCFAIMEGTTIHIDLVSANEAFLNMKDIIYDPLHDKPYYKSRFYMDRF